MTFTGISRTFSTENGSQYDAIGAFWDEMSERYGRENLRGLGYGWGKGSIEYAIGLKDGTIEGYGFEIGLPDCGWTRVTGRTDELDRIYEKIYMDGPLTYEIETFSDDGNCSVSYYRQERISTMDERMQRQIDFSLEIDKEKNVFRQTHLTGHGRFENDAEHAWHLATMAYLFREYSNEPVDIAKVMIMCLIHDVVEIDAGDTYAYDPVALASQKEREEKAKQRIFSLLPDDQKEELTSLFDEFEANETVEARFAHAMDNFQPVLINDSNGGMDWAEHGVDAATVYRRQNKTKLGSEKIFEITDMIMKKNIEKGTLKRSE